MIIWRLAFAVVCFTLLTAVKSQNSFNNCREIEKSTIVDYRLVLGNWFVFGVTSGRLSKCYKYRIEADNENNFFVYEEYMSLLPGVWRNKYGLTYNLWSPELTMNSKLLGILPLWNTWRVVRADSQFQRYMILYRCGLFQEEAQIWVRDSDLSYGGGPIPKHILTAIETLGYKASDFEFKHSWECYE